MSRSGVITFKGAPLTLAGNEVKDGQPAPDFKVHYFEGGMKQITLADVKGKPAIISVVPSLDTPVCDAQTKRFNDEAGKLPDLTVYTVSISVPSGVSGSVAGIYPSARLLEREQQDRLGMVFTRTED